MNTLLGSIPDDLLRTVDDSRLDRARASKLLRHIEGTGYRPRLIDLHDERVKRGLVKPYDPRAALEQVKKRQAQRDARKGPRR